MELARSCEANFVVSLCLQAQRSHAALYIFIVFVVAFSLFHVLQTFHLSSTATVLVFKKAISRAIYSVKKLGKIEHLC